MFEFWMNRSFLEAIWTIWLSTKASTTRKILHDRFSSQSRHGRQDSFCYCRHADHPFCLCAGLRERRSLDWLNAFLDIFRRYPKRKTDVADLATVLVGDEKVVIRADHWGDIEVQRMWVWPKFSLRKMACSHCGAIDMNSNFMNRLSALREEFGQPMIETSGYRCSGHPVEAKKDKPGVHTLGRAVDINIYGHSIFDILPLLKGHGFTGIGLKQSGQHRSRFLHIDDLGEGWPRPTCWTY